jgi:transposase-like protein
MREQTVKYILEKNRSATQVAEEMGIDTNTVCRWVRDYRRKHNLPSFAETKGMKRAEPKSNTELLYQVQELKREKKKVLEDEKEKVEILKIIPLIN